MCVCMRIKVYQNAFLIYTANYYYQCECHHLTVFFCILPAQRSKLGTCYGNVAGWMSHASIVSKWLNLFQPPGSTIILVSSDSCTDTQFQGNSGALNTRGWEKLAIFDGNHRLSRKWCEVSRWCYGMLIGSHGCPIQWYHFRWPWVTPNPGFKVTILTSRISKKSAF